MSKLKLIIIVFSFLALLYAYGGGNGASSNFQPGATGEWTWVSGSNHINQKGAYGTKGTAAPSNAPRARMGAASWIDSSGNLWLFGGCTYALAFATCLNDLWKYDPKTNEWTWVSGSDTTNQAGIYGTKGTAAPSNVPGARHSAASWIDSSGNLWLFGGWTYGSDIALALNDLWKYDPKSNEWTWVSGSNAIDQPCTPGKKGRAAASNVPGARHSAASWIDSSGNLWLFGGSDLWVNHFNDLWKYDPKTNEWAWVSGDYIMNEQGSYGNKGRAGSSSVPGARQSAASWIDSSGNLWLFGGAGIDSSDEFGILNDLWKYNPKTNKWTWVSGREKIYQVGVYGTQGTTAPSRVPGARYSAASWIDSSGNLWLFGGFGASSAKDNFLLNDLWKYDPKTNEWTWVSGSNIMNHVGFYGTMGTAAPSNVPSARYSAAAWVDSSGNLWLFGGQGLSSPGIYKGYYGDLWQYTR